MPRPRRATGTSPMTTLLSLVMLVASGAAGALGGEPAGSVPVQRIETAVALPGSGIKAVRLKGDDRVFFVSDNGRWLIDGRLHDLWAGKRLAGIAEIAAAAGHIDLKGFEAIWPSLAPISIGSGESTVVAFVSPTCPLCRQLFDQLPGLADRHRFLLMLVPTDAASGPLIRMLSCAADQAAALGALLSGDGTPLPQDPDCDLAPMHKRLITQALLGVRTVPTLIRADGAVAAGLPEDLGRWLEGAEG